MCLSVRFLGLQIYVYEYMFLGLQKERKVESIPGPGCEVTDCTPSAPRKAATTVGTGLAEKESKPRLLPLERLLTTVQHVPGQRYRPTHKLPRGRAERCAARPVPSAAPRINYSAPARPPARQLFDRDARLPRLALLRSARAPSRSSRAAEAKSPTSPQRRRFPTASPHP